MSFPFRIQKARSDSYDNNVMVHYDKHIVSNGHKYIILLHGLGGSLNSWSPIRTILHQAKYSTIAVDLRGCGKSPKNEQIEFYDWKYFMQDILNIIKKEQIKEAVIVGHCFGGMIALNLEAAFPHTAKALVLINTSYKPPSFMHLLVDNAQVRKLYSLLVSYLPNVTINSYSDFHKYIGSSDINIRRFFSDVIHTSVKSYSRILEKIMSYDGSKYLKKIRVPTLILAGTNDIIFPIKIAQYLHQKIPRSSLQLINDGNHIMVINHPQEVASAILTFLQEHHF